MNEVNAKVDRLNELVTVNNDRIHGYQKAAEETRDPDLRTLFNQYAQQSAGFKMELANERATERGFFPKLCNVYPVRRAGKAIGFIFVLLQLKK